MTPEVTVDDTLQVQVSITNNGDRDGKEVAQLYIAQLTGASVVRYKKLLHQFEKVTVPARSTVQITFNMPISDLAHYDANMVFRVEPGTFQLWVGPNSNENNCLTSELSVKSNSEERKSKYHWIFDN
eukprot:TRINITY_DN11965_c0_g1_i1.p1 TRINITY_DN11965_c0_g1~~TRINITY_DN11965_c0_g1_i1.p1  ORF type:complete len:127 (+),score=35.56 TRINITY_DN11965_c0_g1_i1:471-851(+)